MFLSRSSFSQLQYVNGNLSTGAVSNSGVAAPVGYTWSELQSNLGEPTITNFKEGYPIDYGVNLRHLLADDFIVPSGQTWSISSFEFYVFCLGAVTLPVTELGIEIWNGDPSLGLSTMLYGNVTTNTFDVVNSGDALMYSIRNTSYNPGGVGSETANLDKKIWKIRGNFNITLGSGTYWVLFQPRFNTVTHSPVVPLNRYPHTRGYPANSNARFYQNAPGETGWFNGFDGGLAINGPASQVPQDFPFNINYTLLLNNNEVKQQIFKLYPNPTRNQLTFQTNERISEVPQTVILYDVRGLKVFENKINTIENNSFTIDISSLNKGIYFIKVLDTENVIYTNKIVKE